MRWEQGRAVIDAMLKSGELQKVPPSRDRADRLLRQAAAPLSHRHRLLLAAAPPSFHRRRAAVPLSLAAVRCTMKVRHTGLLR